MSARGALRIGTRASQLALWQANRVAELLALQPEAPAATLVHIRTEGDARTDIPLWRAGGRAFFTHEIDRALLGGDIDVAVHSLKDLATALEQGLTLCAVLEREDPRDALIARAGVSLAALPAGARVGTSSLRRRAFLARARPDLKLEELRGNVPTRIERLDQGGYEAIVLAAAGLKRLGLAARISEYLSPQQFPPAVAQGAIGVVVREGDTQVARWVKGLDHFATRVAIVAERALLRRIEGGCQVPLGALAAVSDLRLSLEARVCALDGSRSLAASGETRLGAADATPESAIGRATALGERLGDELLAQGAMELIAQLRAATAVSPP